MFRPETELFFQFPAETPKRILHPVVVTDVAGDVVTARFEEPGLVPNPGQTVLIYFDSGREFRQQAARVTAVHASDPVAIVAFQTTGQSVSAEGRECFRVRTITLDLFCTFGAEERCPIHDVSATGLSVVASSIYQIGDGVRISFRHGAIAAEGEVCVQSIRELHSGRFRYGLHAIGNPPEGRALRDALNQISLAIQRTQLKRLSGSA